VRVAVIDTGMDYEHPDLQGRVAVRRNFVDGDDGAFRQDRHGTQVGGIIAATADNKVGIVGIAPESQLLALKACWQSSGAAPYAVCNSFTLAEALEAALAAHADVVNLSLAGPSDPLLSRLIRRGLDQGILFVGAVAPAQMHAGFPTDVAGVLAVESSEDAAPDSTHLRAPGHEVLTLLPGGRCDFASGSSLATAEVTGTLALVRAALPRLSAPQAQQLLARTSQSVATENGSMVSVNACAAVADALRTQCNAPAGAVAAKDGPPAAR
jgi:subtilisin family serine protease